MSQTLKFGIMYNGVSLKKWQLFTILHLIKNKNIKLKLLIADKRHSSTLKKFKKFGIDRILYMAMKFFFRPNCEKSIKTDKLFEGISSLSCETIIKNKYSEYFYESDIEKINSYNLDFILRFSFGIIRGDILKSSRYGIWSYHHHDENKYRGNPPCFWEIYNQDNQTGTIIQKLTEALDGGVILKKKNFKTINYSYSKLMDLTHYGSANWPIKIAEKILDGDTKVFDSSPSSSNSKIYKLPSNKEMFKFFTILTKNYYKKN